MSRCFYPGRAVGTLGLVVASVAMVPGVSTGAAPHTVRITLVAGKTQANGSFNFDGSTRKAR